MLTKIGIVLGFLGTLAAPSVSRGDPAKVEPVSTSVTTSVHTKKDDQGFEIVDPDSVLFYAEDRAGKEDGTLRFIWYRKKATHFAVSPRTAGSPAARGQIAALTLRAVLSKLMDDVQQAINNARNAGNSVAMEAGVQASIAISDAQNAYERSLNLTADRFDAGIKSSIDQLTSVVNDVTANTFGTLDKLTARTQLIVNTLPFRNGQPQVIQMLPRFVVPAQQSYPVQIRVQGNFVDAASKGLTPTFITKQHSYAPSANTTQSLTFSVPLSDLLSPNAIADPRHFSVGSGTLVVPWRDGIWEKLHLKRPSSANFVVLIGALPPSPGTIKVIHTTKHDVTQTKRFTTGQYQQHSDHDDDINHPYSVTPDSGWTLVRNTYQFIPSGLNEGDWHWNFVGDDGNQLRWMVATIHHRFGTSGKIDWNMAFTETKTDTMSEVATEDLSLNWGDSKSLPYAAGTWKVVFDGFDGSHAEFTGADLSNPFLKIRDQGGALVIGTTDPKSLIWP